MKDLKEGIGVLIGVVLAIFMLYLYIWACGRLAHEIVGKDNFLQTIVSFIILIAPPLIIYKLIKELNK
ncbi:MAG: hypothetical protein LBU37_08715 [Tannerellaceae bacterium]|jgi:Mg/Co/Ni transporter MgtE|nr:hypothetical protein [Tannerellaceae bacterium]